MPEIEDIGMECELTKDWGTFRHESIMVMRLVDDGIEIGKYESARSVSGLVFCSCGHQQAILSIFIVPSLPS